MVDFHIFDFRVQPARGPNVGAPTSRWLSLSVFACSESTAIVSLSLFLRTLYDALDAQRPAQDNKSSTKPHSAQQGVSFEF